ncbi:uncharacterized protein KQ657_004443 [Scheffersomyces spartinae]|uniref:Amino acid permease/ SLC12A domain-containing protein n=1 Tax=Scheffersomyces spartinae TaxID=45513 RepID=A0A9P7VBJ0_9ASCO|nr:uncharacterized protein KQ657_004443 [Scheffersomyces spartinae]KAG7194763.1 hypothetical protein KQ657_004443 [Scheffersomyces spartinae]
MSDGSSMEKNLKQDSPVENTLTVTSPYENDKPSTSGSRWEAFKDSFKRPELGNEVNMDEANDFQRSLKQRQLQMIALTGCVGSGLLVASGKALSNGPACVLVAWAVVSSFLYCTMQSLAELGATFPVSGSFATFATRFIDDSWGFAVGWNYAMFWIMVLPLELVASSLTIQFWKSKINLDVWITIFYLGILVLNLAGNKGFGEFEFIAALIKLAAIVGFNILSIVLICGGGDEGFIGAKYWREFGAFTTGFKGFVSVLITAVYSLAGTELIGLTASEAKDARKTLPKAIKQVFWRIILFYMITLTLIGFLVAPNNPELIGASSDASASPFVIAIRNGGIKVLPSIFNVVVLIALLSIANSSVYGCSRTLVALSQQGMAPKILNYVDRKGRPTVAYILVFFVGLLSFISASKKREVAFEWLMALSGLSSLFTWFSICLSHYRFRLAMKHQGRSLGELPYLALTGTWGSIYSMVCLVVILCLQFWTSVWPYKQKPNVTAFFENYLGAIVVLVFFIGHKIYKRKFFDYVKLEDVDLDSGRNVIDMDLLMQEIAQEKEALRHLPWYKKVLNFLF